MTRTVPGTGLFTDGKDPAAMRTIGEVASALGIRPHVLRYWERQFPMLRPLKRSGGRRLYRTADVALLIQIDHLVNHQGFTLKGASAAIVAEHRPNGPVTSAAPDVLAALYRIREQLAKMVEG